MNIIFMTNYSFCGRHDAISVLKLHTNHSMCYIKLVKSLYDLKQSG
jgi:hypothetical protein